MFFEFKDYLIIPVLYCNHSKRYTTADKRKGITKMTKTTFINRLAQTTGLTEEQSSIVVNAIEDHNLFSKDEKALIITDIVQRLGIDEQSAGKYFAEASQIVSSEIKNQTVKWIAGTAVIVIAGIIVFRLKKK